MEANTRKLERIFDQTITYQVPLFQRPYVWTQEANWEPLWEDIMALLDKHLRIGKAHPHFLGAVVLEQLANPTGSIESRQVIDGQQRFTTLQLFLIAARDHAAADERGKYIERFTSLVENRRSMIDFDDELFKVWPTNSNRAAFRAVHEAGSPVGLDKAIKQSPSIADGSNNIVGAYNFFHAQLHDWLTGKLDDENDQTVLRTKTLDDRYDTLWQVVKDCLQVVVIDLDKNDETQVIFETLNARGQDLLPADLIKNYLFRRAVSDNENIERLYSEYWQHFESKWWRDLVKQGRINRPRVDVFINYYLAMMTMDEVKSSHLFTAFKEFSESKAEITDSLLVIPKTSAEHITQLARYADVYKTFYDAGKHQRLAIFLDRLVAIDTTTVFPLLLYLHAEMLPGREEEFDKIISMVESYLFRRMICGLTAKNYNRFFLDLLRAIDKEGKVSVEFFADYLLRSTADSSFFPDDSKFEYAIKELPLYGRLAQYRVRAILEALELHEQSVLSPAIALPSGLTIEHLMPQTWQTHWPLSETDRADPVKEQKAIQRRDRVLNTIGNLTLVTGSLNPALSNSAWEAKRPELLKYGKLNLTQYFHGPNADTWNEDNIEARSQHIFEQLKQIWPSIR